jgi:hypothetical protein
MGILGKIWDVATDIGHAVTGTMSAAEKRNAQGSMNEQIRAYREQTELTRSEIARKKGEELAEKRRINEKQIRSLRRNFRTQGLMGVSDSGMADMSNELGG